MCGCVCVCVCKKKLWFNGRSNCKTAHIAIFGHVYSLRWKNISPNSWRKKKILKRRKRLTRGLQGRFISKNVRARGLRVQCGRQRYQSATSHLELREPILPDSPELRTRLSWDAQCLCVCALCVFVFVFGCVVSCCLLVEEGEQISHNDEGLAGQRLQNLPDVNCSLLEAFHG